MLILQAKGYWFNTNTIVFYSKIFKTFVINWKLVTQLKAQSVSLLISIPAYFLFVLDFASEEFSSKFISSLQGTHREILILTKLVQYCSLSILHYYSKWHKLTKSSHLKSKYSLLCKGISTSSGLREHHSSRICWCHMPCLECLPHRSCTFFQSLPPNSSCTGLLLRSPKKSLIKTLRFRLKLTNFCVSFCVFNCFHTEVSDSCNSMDNTEKYRIAVPRAQLSRRQLKLFEFAMQIQAWHFPLYVHVLLLHNTSSRAMDEQRDLQRYAIWK